MASRDQKFGELRSLLQQTPSEESWEQLGVLLGNWKLDDHFREVVLPYARELLAGWPEELKIAPPAWAKGLTKKTKKPAPLMELASGLQMRASRVGKKGVEYLSQSPEIAHITYLDLSNNGLQNDGGVSLANSPHLTNLKTLILTNAKIGNRGAIAIANNPRFASLEELDLTGNEIIEPGCDAIRNSSHLRKEIRDRAYSWYSHERADREARYYGGAWE